MTPIDDELRGALQRAAAHAPSSSHIDTTAVERRARGMRQRRASIAVGATVAVAAVAAISVANLGGNGPSKQPLSGGSDGIVASESPTPSPSSCFIAPPAGTCEGTYSPSAVDGWGFRGDAMIRDKSLQQFATAYAAYRTSAADQLTESTYVPVYADVMANQSGDVISVLVKQSNRVSRVATAVLSEGGTQIVADQPVGPTTVLIDALLPADPANILLAITAPGTDQIMYTVDSDTRFQRTDNGVAQFGRSLESKGGDADFVEVKQITGATPSPGSAYAPPGDEFTLASREPGTFHPDPSQPGRLSSPLAGAQFVLSAWQAGDTRTTDRYTTPTGRAAIASNDVKKIGTDIIGRCDQEDPHSYHCSVRSGTDRYKGYTLIMEGTPSTGFQLRAITEWSG